MTTLALLIFIGICVIVLVFLVRELAAIVKKQEQLRDDMARRHKKIEDLVREYRDLVNRQ